MCRVIGTFYKALAICIKDSVSCRRQAQGKKTKERVLPGKYPAIRKHDGKLVGAEPFSKRFEVPLDTKMASSNFFDAIRLASTSKYDEEGGGDLSFDKEDDSYSDHEGRS